MASKYREKNNIFKKSNTFSHKMQQNFNSFLLFLFAKNIVTIGIGGSFEGPKILIESLVGSSGGKLNLIFIYNWI